MSSEETVKPVDLVAARELCRRRDQPINWADYEQCLDEIEKLRDDVAYGIRSFQMCAGYKPVGKS